MRLKAHWICVVGLSLLLTEGSQGDPMDAKDLSPSEVEENLENDSRGERIFAFYTSTSLTRLVTTTITAISTCLSTSVGAPACTGRRRRSSLDKLVNLDEFETDRSELDPSIERMENLQGRSLDESEVTDADDRSGRKLTIWSTAFTTLTVTSTSILPGTTVTASLLCAIPGAGQSCFLG